MANKIKLKYGNIIRAKTTFIVNASNTNLTLGSGVSREFRKHCGGSLYQQYLYNEKKKYSNIKQGDVIITNSGIADNFQFAVHAIIMNYSDDSLTPYPNYRIIRKTIHNIVTTIEKLKIKENLKNVSISIPLLGTGTGKLNKLRVLMLMKRIILKFHLEDLVVFIYVHSLKDYLSLISKNKGLLLK